MKLAQSAIAPLVQAHVPAKIRQEQAKEILRRLEFGQDGYFYLYDLQGNSLMHSRQPELVGQNLLELKDPEAARPLRRFTRHRRGGGNCAVFLDQAQREKWLQTGLASSLSLNGG